MQSTNKLNFKLLNAASNNLRNLFIDLFFNIQRRETEF